MLGIDLRKKVESTGRKTTAHGGREKWEGTVGTPCSRKGN